MDKCVFSGNEAVTTKAGRGKTAILYPFEIIASSSEGSDNSSPEIPEKQKL